MVIGDPYALVIAGFEQGNHLCVDRGAILGQLGHGQRERRGVVGVPDRELLLVALARGDERSCQTADEGEGDAYQDGQQQLSVK